MGHPRDEENLDQPLLERRVRRVARWWVDERHSLEDCLLVSEAIEGALAMVRAQARVANAAKRKLRIRHVHHGVVDNCGAAAGVSEQLVGNLLVLRKHIERQWLWPRA